MIQSPLNYTGGKYKLLPQILPLFPKGIDVFVDLFCGGCNVGINVDCNRVIYNDLNENLLYLYNTFKNLDKESVLEWIYEIIEKYNLSLVSKHGYDYYGCESSKGLGNYNREGYLRLRADFNQKYANENFDYYYYVMLYVIIVSSIEIEKLFTLKLNKFISSKTVNQEIIDLAVGLCHADIAKACENAIKQAILNDKKYVSQNNLKEMLIERKIVYQSKEAK